MRRGKFPKYKKSNFDSIHWWQKTSLVTKGDRFGMYDVYECVRCGITGKRYGLNERIAVDSRFKAKRIRTCKEETE